MAQRGRLRGEVAGFDGHVLGGCAVAVPVGQSIDRLADGDADRAIPQRLDDPRNLVRRDRGAAVVAGVVHPGRRPGQLGRREAGRVHAYQGVAYADVRTRCLLVGELLGPTTLTKT